MSVRSTRGISLCRRQTIPARGTPSAIVYRRPESMVLLVAGGLAFSEWFETKCKRQMEAPERSAMTKLNGSRDEGEGGSVNSLLVVGEVVAVLIL